jgi:formylglycine-generating enzyme required for sulfatase activity
MLALIALLAIAHPSGMLAIPSGTFARGRDDSARPDEIPRHHVHVDAFLIDATLVTRADFARFVDAMRYQTSAEKLGFGMVAVEGMDDWKWDQVKGANWRKPFGDRKTEYVPRDDDPVTMVSWDDADAYCRWAHKRLPTEAELEYAARAGKSDTRFPWGDLPYLPGTKKLGCNFWQGRTHHADTREDGYLYVSPVRAFPPNAFGLFDPVGNVWQWTSDWYSETYYAETARDPDLAQNPAGPKTGAKKVARGGSWWCSKTTCQGFGLYYRGKNEPDAPFNNNGFRCAK